MSENDNRGDKLPAIAEDTYKPFPVDAEHSVQNSIKSIFDSAIKAQEELGLNCLDAGASNIEIEINKQSKNTSWDDDGKGILVPDELFMFGSNHKQTESEANPELEITGKFGEGAKSNLSMASDMIYYTNNGTEEDLEIHMRSPFVYGQKNVSYNRHPKGTCKSTIGTKVVCWNISDQNLNSIEHELPNHTAWRFVWIIASKRARFTVKVVNEDGSVNDSYTIPVATKFHNLFADYPAKLKTIDFMTDENGIQHKIEGIFEDKKDKPAERKIVICYKHVVVKEIPTEYNVFAIVNFNGLPVTRDRASYNEHSDVTRLFLTKLDNYMSPRFEKATLHEKMPKRMKKQTMLVLHILDKLAELEGLSGRLETRTAKLHIDPEQQRNDENTELLRTYSKSPQVQIVEESKVLWEKRKGRKTKPREEGAAAGGNIPTTEEAKNHAKSGVDPKIKERDLLVQTVRRKGDKTVATIRADRVDESDEKRPVTKEGFFEINVQPLVEQQWPHQSYHIMKSQTKAVISIYQQNAYYELKKPVNSPYNIEEVLPQVAAGATDILYGERIKDISEWKKQYDSIIHNLAQSVMRAEYDDDTSAADEDLV